MPKHGSWWGRWSRVKFMWTVVSRSNTSLSFSVLCSVSMLSSSSSDFCTSTSDALDTLKIPWTLTRTFTLTFELSPEAWGITFWMTYWPAWEFDRTCLHTECIHDKDCTVKICHEKKRARAGPRIFATYERLLAIEIHVFAWFLVSIATELSFSLRSLYHPWTR